MAEKSDVQVVHLRLPADLLAQLDAHVEKLRTGTLPMATRADAVRAILAEKLRPAAKEIS